MQTSSSTQTDLWLGAARPIALSAPPYNMESFLPRTWERHTFPRIAPLETWGTRVPPNGEFDLEGSQLVGSRVKAAFAVDPMAFV